jgi:hypothetical protein
MEIEELVELLMEKTRHSEPQDDRPFVNERMVRSDVWALVESYTETIVDDRIATLERELRAYEEKK